MADRISNYEGVRHFIRETLQKHNFDVSCAILEVTDREAKLLGYAVLFGGTSDLNGTLPEAQRDGIGGLAALRGRGVVFAFFEDLPHVTENSMPLFTDEITAQIAIARMFEFIDHERFHIETNTTCEDFASDEAALSHVIDDVVRRFHAGEFRGKTND